MRSPIDISSMKRHTCVVKLGTDCGIVSPNTDCMSARSSLLLEAVVVGFMPSDDRQVVVEAELLVGTVVACSYNPRLWFRPQNLVGSLLVGVSLVLSRLAMSWLSP